ncbi:hypothetical protein [Pedobacter rhodius]|uniref:Uncharacterized protein n=1 Tax=Pedobacter rhodius TaxID=3004098 RepID=A0ABT4KV09_9SPHI|nr:hypothetical protein [Pedobacter sp. SJ11]MCZ4222773.1 hypothetical protein [Pedobacter sp. SJ11]
MKTSILLFFFLVLTKLSFGQQLKQNIDYQYYRDDKNYYAFELFKNQSSNDDNLMLNFTSNVEFKKIDKIYIQAGTEEVKVKFKVRAEVVSSDNPAFRFYPVVFSLKDLTHKEIDCEAKINFKMDNGMIYTLPFNICNLKLQLAQN